MARMIKWYIVMAVNIYLGIIITGANYPMVGLVFGLFALAVTCIGYNTKVGFVIVKSQMKHYRNIIESETKEVKMLLSSVACLAIAVQIGAAIGLFVTTGAIILVAFCILLACGYFFDGVKSGWTPNSAFNLAKIVVKVFCFLQVTIDRIAEWIAKLELKIFGIEK